MSRARISDIITLAARMSGLTVAEIKSHRRFRHLAHARSAIVVVARRNGHSYPEIARVMRRDHSTVVHAFHRAAAYKNDPELGSFIERLADEAKTATPFLDGIKFDFVLPPSKPKPAPKEVRPKPKNDFRPGKFVSDDSHHFHDRIAIGSAKLAAAIADARAA